MSVLTYYITGTEPGPLPVIVEPAIQAEIPTLAFAPRSIDLLLTVNGYGRRYTKFWRFGMDIKKDKMYQKKKYQSSYSSLFITH